MPDSDPLIRHFEEVLADPNARPATKVAAGKELARLRERIPAEGKEPLGIMSPGSSRTRSPRPLVL